MRTWFISFVDSFDNFIIWTSNIFFFNIWNMALIYIIYFIIKVIKLSLIIFICLFLFRFRVVVVLIIIFVFFIFWSFFFILIIFFLFTRLFFNNNFLFLLTTFFIFWLLFLFGFWSNWCLIKILYLLFLILRFRWKRHLFIVIWLNWNLIWIKNIDLRAMKLSLPRLLHLYF